MDGVSLENLLALQRSYSNQSGTGAAPSTSEAFASMLENELSGNTDDKAGTVSTEDIQKEMMLSMCLMMCGSSLSSSPAMESLLSVLSGNPSSQSSEASSEASTGKSIVDSALTRIGDPYSKSKRGSGDYVDCSYLAQWAYDQNGISIPGTAAGQAKYCYDNGYTISKDDLKPGDLVFWTEKGSNSRWHEIHHVAIYAGDGKIVEAKTSTKGVVLDDMWGENGDKWQVVMYARPYAKNNSSDSST